MAIRNFIAAASIAALTLTGTSAIAALADEQAAVTAALQQEVSDIDAQLPALLAIIRDGTASAQERDDAFQEYRALNARKSSLNFHIGAVGTYSSAKLLRVIDLYGLNINLDDDDDNEPDPVFNVKQALEQRIEENTQEADALLVQLRSGELSDEEFEDTFDAYRALRARVSSMTFHVSVIDGYSESRQQLLAEFYMLDVAVSVS